MNEQRYCRGQIYYVYPKEVIGSEQEGGRPAIIVSNDVCNEFSGVVEVVFLTTKKKHPLPTHVSINSTSRPSIALCEQIASVDKARFGDYINEVSQGEMKNLEKAMLVSLQIATNLKGSKVLEVWRKMMESYDFEDEPLEEAIKISSEEERMPEKKHGAGLASESELIDIEAEPAYIKLAAERDVYKELYTDLLKMLRA